MSSPRSAPVGDDRWTRMLDDMVRAFETGTFLTALEVPGKVAKLPAALGGARFQNAFPKGRWPVRRRDEPAYEQGKRLTPHQEG
jgi:hypothetical protein